MVTYRNLQTDLLQALDQHVDILKEVEDIESAAVSYTHLTLPTTERV